MNENNTYSQRQKLTRGFLREYLLQRALARPVENDQKLNSDQEPETVYDAATEVQPPLAEARRPDLEELLPGQIRLLTQPAERISVLVMRPWGGDCWLVIPFSTYSYPATDEEWCLGGDRTMNLKVLQLWNARSVNARFLRQSWLVDELDEQEKICAEAAFACSLAGDDMPPEMLAEAGLPIVAGHDPRIDYKEEQLARFAELDAADLQWSELAAEAASKPVRDFALGKLTSDCEKNDFSSLPLPIAESTSFSPARIFASLPLAAAGRSSVSQCWHYPSSANLLLQHLLCQKSEKLPLALQAETVTWCGHQAFPTCGDEQKLWLWDWQGQQINQTICKDALFFHRQQKILLGTGYALLENQEGTIVLRDWLSRETAVIESPAEITIFLTEPEDLGNG